MRLKLLIGTPQLHASQVRACAEVYLHACHSILQARILPPEVLRLSERHCQPQLQVPWFTLAHYYLGSVAHPGGTLLQHT